MVKFGNLQADSIMRHKDELKENNDITVPDDNEALIDLVRLFSKYPGAAFEYPRAFTWMTDHPEYQQVKRYAMKDPKLISLSIKRTPMSLMMR